VSLRRLDDRPVRLSLHSLRHFRDHSMTDQFHSKSASCGHDELWLGLCGRPPSVSFSPSAGHCPAFCALFRRPQAGAAHFDSLELRPPRSDGLRFVSVTSTELRIARLMSASPGFASVMSGWVRFASLMSACLRFAAFCLIGCLMFDWLPSV
jgi:hypothetical protein